MDGISMGAGLAALAFWGFIAIVVVAGVWESIRKRDAMHETLRQALDKGQNLDPATIDKLTGKNDNMARDLRVGGYIMVGIAPGMVALGVALSFVASKALVPLIGVAALCGCIAWGMLLAAKVIDRDAQD